MKRLLRALYLRTFPRYTTAAIITDRRPFADSDAWLPSRTLGAVLDDQDARREW